MAFENATDSIFIYTKLAPQPSSEAANGLTAQILSGSTNGEEKPKICSVSQTILFLGEQKPIRELKEQEQTFILGLLVSRPSCP